MARRLKSKSKSSFHLKSCSSSRHPSDLPPTNAIHEHTHSFVSLVIAFHCYRSIRFIPSHLIPFSTTEVVHLHRIGISASASSNIHHHQQVYPTRIIINYTHNALPTVARPARQEFYPNGSFLGFLCWVSHRFICLGHVFFQVFWSSCTSSLFGTFSLVYIGVLVTAYSYSMIPLS